MSSRYRVRLPPLLRPLALVLALVVSGCGGEETEQFRPLAPEDPGPVHVHGLGIDPADGSLLIATHTGLYRVGEAEKKAKRVGERYQDTMGFTVVGPNHYLGSGHPDLREAREKDLPPLLGLIESTDAGASWKPISLLGEADFHVLRFAGDRVYGFDSTGIRLMVSEDDGKTWEERAVPTAELQAEPPQLLDLVVDPEASEHLIAASEQGLFESRDAGETWRPLLDGAGLLTWPTPAHLYMVTGQGLVFSSGNAGKAWSSVGEIGGQPAAFLATSEQELYVALHDGTIKRSLDGGAAWAVRSTP